VSLPKIRLERCKPPDEGIWLLDPAQERHLTRALRLYEGAFVEGLLPTEAGGEKVLLRLCGTPEGMALREVGREQERADGVRLHLLIGLLKADQFDAVLRSAAELGLYAVMPVVCERSVPRVAESDVLRKASRWQKVMDEGSKVSGYVMPPIARAPVRFADIPWDSLPAARYAAILEPRATPLSEIGEIPDELAFAVGPEGDWTPEEARALCENGFAPVSLGDGVLRASTSAIVGCGWFRLMAHRRGLVNGLSQE